MVKHSLISKSGKININKDTFLVNYSIEVVFPKETKAGSYYFLQFLPANVKKSNDIKKLRCSLVVLY